MEFLRGDPNADGAIDVGDTIFILDLLFSGGRHPSCADAADGNDDGTTNIADTIYLLSFLFSMGAPPPAPFPDCGVDPTPDAMRCVVHPPCP